jgi:hypothetical protein
MPAGFTLDASMATSTADANIVPISLSHAQCVNTNCSAYAIAQNFSLLEEPLPFSSNYARYATYIYLSIICLFSVFHLYHRFFDRTERSGTHTIYGPDLWDQCIGIWRSVMYRRLCGRISFYIELPSVGTLLMLISSIIAVSVLTFADHHYYRPKVEMGNSPLGIRAGMIATALIPLSIALAGKVRNYI